MTRLCVTGGRNYTNQHFVNRALSGIHAIKPISAIIHGATPTGTGADWFADAWAYRNGIVVCRYPVMPAIDGSWPAAGQRRNARMLTHSKPDQVIAFSGNSGTANCIAQAERMDIPIWDLDDERDLADVLAQIAASLGREYG